MCMIKNNIIKLGDSRDLLLELKEKSVQSIYFDPPFNSSRIYSLSTEDNLGFNDKFSSRDEYTALIEPMIKSMTKILKSNGSFFYHISAAEMLAAHYLCDKYFKRVQPIFWRRSRSKNNIKNKLGACTDVIFWCSNVDKPKFNMVYQPLDSYYFENSYKNNDSRGFYALGHLVYTKTQSTKNIERLYSIEHEGRTYAPESGWRLSKEDLLSLIKDDRVHFPSKLKGNPYKKLYKHESPGKPCTDIWDDIHSIAQGSQPRLYPTQKPTALLERIIKMSTDEGDVVLDPVAGGGTTGVVASGLNRKFILFDKNEEAVEICKTRLKGVSYVSD